MGLDDAEIGKIREQLSLSKKPLIFFHDDPDGLCSFLLLYRRIGEGKGIIVKTTPLIDHRFLRKVEEYSPDRIFIVDIANVDDEFVDTVKQQIIWIDHHGPYPKAQSNIMYFNPRLKESSDNIPASSLCYQAVQENIWIAAVGTIGDWMMPDFIEKFKKEYPDLIDRPYGSAQDILFTTRLGKLARIFSFVLKGTTREAMKYVKVLTRIKEPQEILDKTSPQGKFVYKRYEKINREYEKILAEAEKNLSDDRILLYTYYEDNMSFTGDLSNELIYRHPEKIVIVGRRKSGEVKCSLRSSQINISKVLEKALAQVSGYGGGHEKACGACINEEEFPQFIDVFRQELKNRS
jgi:single-stranded DNA-specific DHH superfamily exonuclease